VNPRIALLPALMTALPAVAGGDRLFADGFEPCCRIGGTVSGLADGGLVLHLAAGDIAEDRPVSANGIYDFTASVPPGTHYALAVATQPDAQTCRLSIDGGTMGGSAIDNADVVCTGNLEWDGGTWGQDWN
jgi:hypothetical protein